MTIIFLENDSSGEVRRDNFHGAPLMNRSIFIRLLLLVGSSLFFFPSCAVRMPSPAAPPPVANERTMAMESTAQGKVAVYLIADSLHTSLAVPRRPTQCLGLGHWDSEPASESLTLRLMLCPGGPGRAAGSGWRPGGLPV